MKRRLTSLLCAALILGAAACGARTEDAPAPQTAPELREADAQNAETPGGVLVVYFSRVGNTDFPDDVDAVSGATLSMEGDTLKGNAQRMAEWMADEAGGDLFAIRTEETYPADYRETTDAARREQSEGARPALKTHVEDFDGYSTVYLVFPNWWADLPMPVYSFLDEVDCSGKTLYVSVTHEGSGFSRTVGTIRELEPGASVIEGISVRGASVPDAEDAVRQFVKDNH